MTARDSGKDVLYLLGPTKFDLLKLLQKAVIQLQMTRDDREGKSNDQL